MTLEANAGLPDEIPTEQPSTAADLDTSTSNPIADDPAEALREENAALASRLRAALLAADPAIAPELVGGSTVAEIEASYAAAKAIADRVRESVRRETAATPGIPAGAPGRSTAPVLNPREKIRAGLSSPAGQPAS